MIKSEDKTWNPGCSNHRTHIYLVWISCDLKFVFSVLPCQHLKCSKYAKCLADVSRAGDKCVCRTGYTGNGTFCQGTPDDLISQRGMVQLNVFQTNC